MKGTQTSVRASETQRRGGPRSRRSPETTEAGGPTPQTVGPELDAEDVAEDVLPAGTLVCALTGESRSETPQELTLQSVIEQFHHEYGVALEDMQRDVRLPCVSADPRTGQERTRHRTISLAVFEPSSDHENR